MWAVKWHILVDNTDQSVPQSLAYAAAYDQFWLYIPVKIVGFTLGDSHLKSNWLDSLKIH